MTENQQPRSLRYKLNVWDFFFSFGQVTFVGTVIYFKILLKFEEMVCYSLFPKYKYVNELHFMSLILMNFLKGKQQIFLD